MGHDALEKEPSHASPHRGGRGELPHHFENVEQQADANKIGMWLFLSTEILLFSGLFCAYAVYRARHPEIFVYAHKFLDYKLGGLNTIILISSSLTMAWAVRCAQLKQRGLLIVMMLLTVLGGAGFMGIKYVEYSQKWKHGLLWGTQYKPQAHHEEEAAPGGETAAHGPGLAGTVEAGAGSRASAAEGAAGSDKPKPDPNRTLLPPAADGPRGLSSKALEDAAAASHGGAHFEASPKNVHTFFGVYFAMTGLHGIHVALGMIVILYFAFKSLSAPLGNNHAIAIDMVGLYWHLVDLIWIFLFPLLYLIH